MRGLVDFFAEPPVDSAWWLPAVLARIRARDRGEVGGERLARMRWGRRGRPAEAISIRIKALVSAIEEGRRPLAVDRWEDLTSAGLYVLFRALRRCRIDEVSVALGDSDRIPGRWIRVGEDVPLYPEGKGCGIARLASRLEAAGIAGTYPVSGIEVVGDVEPDICALMAVGPIEPPGADVEPAATARPTDLLGATVSAATAAMRSLEERISAGTFEPSVKDVSALARSAAEIVGAGGATESVLEDLVARGERAAGRARYDGEDPEEGQEGQR